MSYMEHDQLMTLCHLVKESAPGALVAASPLPPGLYRVTVVHEPEQADAVDAAIVVAGLTGERLDPTRVKVRVPE